MFGCIQNFRHFEKLAFCNYIPTRYPLTDINPIKIQEILNISKLVKHLLPKAILLTDISFNYQKSNKILEILQYLYLSFQVGR